MHTHSERGTGRERRDFDTLAGSLHRCESNQVSKCILRPKRTGCTQRESLPVQPEHQHLQLAHDNNEVNKHHVNVCILVSGRGITGLQSV